MLDLSVSTRSVAGVDVAPDAEDSSLFFVLPPAPKLAFADGEPDIQLLRLVQNGELVGGHLRLAIELQHAPSLLDRVQAELEEELKRKPVTLSPLQLKDASAELHFVGREVTDAGGLTSLLVRPYGRTPALLDAPHTANFSLSLEPNGVRLMEAALRSEGAPIGVSYLLTIEGLWPAQRILARVDWGRVYDHFSTQFKQGFLFFGTDIQKVTEDLVESHAIQIQVVRGVAEEPGTDDGTAAALAWIQRDLVERFCEPALPLNREAAHASLGTLGETFGVGSSFVAKSLTQIERAVAEIDFQQERVVKRSITTQAHLADLLAGSPPSKHIADADLEHPFFQRMSLTVRSAQKLSDLYLKETILEIDYGTAQGALRLTPDQSEAKFECWADASANHTWILRPQVTFADDAPLEAGKPFVLDPIHGGVRDVTLDLKRMAGLARCAVRPPVDSTIALCELHLSHRRDSAMVGEADLALAPNGPEQAAWFRDYQPGDVMTAEVKYLLTDGRIVQIPPYRVDSEILRLPAAFPGVLTVQIVADDDWDGLDRIAFALQKRADSATGTYVFDKPGSTVAVNLDMPDPSDRTFRYRMTRTLSSGVEESDDWTETDVAVVIAGKTSPNRLIVDVTPVGPELPQAGIRLIEVEFSYVDAVHEVRDQKTVVIAAKADRPRWEVAIQDPRLRSYDYRLTVYRMSGGPPQSGHWISTSDRILAVPIVALT